MKKFLICILITFVVTTNVIAETTEADAIFAFIKAKLAQAPSVPVVPTENNPEPKVLGSEYVDCLKQGLKENKPVIICVNKDCIKLSNIICFKTTDAKWAGVSGPKYIVGIPDGTGQFIRIDVDTIEEVLILINPPAPTTQVPYSPVYMPATNFSAGTSC